MKPIHTNAYVGKYFIYAGGNKKRALYSIIDLLEAPYANYLDYLFIINEELLFVEKSSHVRHSISSVILNKAIEKGIIKLLSEEEEKALRILYSKAGRDTQKV